MHIPHSEGVLSMLKVKMFGYQVNINPALGANIGQHMLGVV